MSQRSAKRRVLRSSAMGVILIASSLAWTPMAWAHSDDPKAQSFVEPYQGPGYRAAEGGIAGGVFDADNITLLSWIPLDEFSSFSGTTQPSANDIWGYVSPSGREYAIMGVENHTAWIEVTDPTNATIIAMLPGPTSTWRDMRAYQEHSYSVTEHGDGIQVFDLTDIDNGNVSFVGNVLDGGTPASHNVVLNEDSGYLYRVGGGNNGLRAYDLSDPSAPAYVATWDERYVHDAQIITFTEGPWANREIAFCCSGFNGGWEQPGLDIVDVTDKNDMQVLSRYFYSNAVYSHQGCLSADGQYFFLGDELDEGATVFNSRMVVIDVSDLTDPFEATSYANASPAVTHNLFTLGDYVYAANYSSGLRVFDVSDPLDTSEFGYFDTDPDDNDVDYHGLWGTYPYLPSGIVLGSDRERGLFVWEVDLPVDEINADITGDDRVNVLDLLEVILNWGLCKGSPCPADIDGDGEVGVSDLTAVILNWS